MERAAFGLAERAPLGRCGSCWLCGGCTLLCGKDAWYRSVGRDQCVGDPWAGGLAGSCLPNQQSRLRQAEELRPCSEEKRKKQPKGTARRADRTCPYWTPPSHTCRLPAPYPSGCCMPAELRSVPLPYAFFFPVCHCCCGVGGKKESLPAAKAARLPAPAWWSSLGAPAQLREAGVAAPSFFFFFFLSFFLPSRSFRRTGLAPTLTCAPGGSSLTGSERHERLMCLALAADVLSQPSSP
jgi:hypothetical protein